MARTRSTGKIDKDTLCQIIKDAESSKTFDSLGDLWKEVASIYNAKKGTSISTATIYMRVKEWDIRVDTISGHKKTASIDIKHLQGLIREVEAKGLPSNRSALFMDVAKLLAERKKLTISHSAVATLAKKHNLEIKTPKGERGGAFKNGPRGVRGPRTSRKDKFSKNEAVQESFDEIRKEVPDRFLPVFKRLEGGSMKAAVQLKCLECSDYQTSEIRLCPVKGCSLYAFRPYQGAIKNGEPVEDVDDVEDEVEDVDTEE